MTEPFSEGANGSFSDSFLGEDYARLPREEARRHAKFHQARLLAQDLNFEIPAEIQGQHELRQVLSAHSMVGVFSGRETWFEAAGLENWLRKFTRQDFETAYPKTNGDEFAYHTSRSADLVMSPPFKLREPAPSSPLALPTLVFAPCTLADSKGHRMGRGKGYFDRYLAHHPGVFAVGVCHEDFLVEQFPSSWIASHDRSVNAILTNSRFLLIPTIGDSHK